MMGRFSSLTCMNAVMADLPICSALHAKERGLTGIAMAALALGIGAKTPVPILHP
jgi:hypothetical protein